MWAAPVLMRVWSTSAALNWWRAWTCHSERSAGPVTEQSSSDPEPSFYSESGLTERLIICPCLASFSSSPKSKIARIIFIVALNSPQHSKAPCVCHLGIVYFLPLEIWSWTFSSFSGALLYAWRSKHCFGSGGTVKMSCTVFAFAELCATATATHGDAAQTLTRLVCCPHGWFFFHSFLISLVLPGGFIFICRQPNPITTQIQT